MTSLAELANGQNFKSPSTNYIESEGSLLKNNIEHKRISHTFLSITAQIFLLMLSTRLFKYVL